MSSAGMRSPVGSQGALKARLRETGIKGKLLWRNNLAKVCIAFIVLEVFVALLAPVLVPYPQDIGGATNLQAVLQPPSWAHLFGTDEFGRDIFSRVLYGTRISLGAAAAAVVGRRLRQVVWFVVLRDVRLLGRRVDRHG